jgi:PAS domain S-box-containing protein
MKVSSDEKNEPSKCRKLQIRKAEERYRSILDQMLEGCQILGFDWSYLYINAAAEKHNCRCNKELLGKKYMDMWPGIEATEVFIVIRRCMEERIAHQMDNKFIFPDGREGWFSLSIQPVPEGVFILSIDITERKQAERDRIAREAAEEASRAKSAFVANMSHEIRTPLNAILGFAQVMERDPTLTPRQAEYVRTISRSGAYLLKLINNILDMSKIEAGQTTLTTDVFCLYDLLDDLEAIFRSRAEAKGLQLLMERDKSVPRCVASDEGKLRQVFINLLGNAVKFTETGGVAVRVRAEAVAGTPAAGKESLRLLVEVEDSGPGISDEDMGRLFAAFQQGEAGGKQGGTGLGLAISRKFVEMMGGKLTVTSQVGKGSRFRFEVLLEPAEGVPEREQTVSRRVVALAPGTGPYRILVADDKPDNRFLLCELLRPVGFDVMEASNGVEALAACELWSPHVVLMDMRMPVMDGYEATRRLKSKKTDRNIAVIAVTASAFDDSKKQVMASGVDAYLRKPFRAEELFAVMEQCLGLRYVFADKTAKTPGHAQAASLTPDSLTMLPQELVQAMRQAVSEGDIARLTETISHVAKVDSDVARALQALADRYDYEKISQLLEKEKSDNG